MTTKNRLMSAAAHFMGIGQGLAPMAKADPEEPNPKKPDDAPGADDDEAKKQAAKDKRRRARHKKAGRDEDDDGEDGDMDDDDDEGEGEEEVGAKKKTRRAGDDDGDDGGGRDDAGRLAPWMWAALAVQNVAIVCLVCGRCADNPRWARASRGSSSQRGASIDARKGL